MSEDWYRNATWSESIEHAFFEKLQRARRKESYLRIQASMLATSHPHVTLQLLDHYFQLSDKFDHAQAYCDRAQALLALDRVDEAIDSYEQALAREAEFPNMLTHAFLDLPFLIAIRQIKNKYPRALRTLQSHRSRLMFPVDHFRWHASYSMIAADTKDVASAAKHARLALASAERDHSGFRYHPSVGLVGSEHADMMKKLQACIAR